MTLQDGITEALRLTAVLRENLESGDWQSSGPLLAERGVALARLAELHTAAPVGEREECADSLGELRLADQALQEVGQAARDRAAGEWKNSLGQSPAPRHEYDRAPDLACLDRRA